MGLFSYANDGSKVTVGSAGGGAAPTVIDYTPGDADITYTEAGGVLTGVGGVFDGWKVDNWTLSNSLAESDANNNIDWSCDIAALGQMYGYYYQNWIDVVPQIYKEVRGDFSIAMKILSVGSDDNQRSPGIFYGFPDDGGSLNRVVTFECKGWGATDFNPTAGYRFITGTSPYSGGAVTSVWVKIEKVDSDITMSDSPDGITYTPRVTRNCDPGSVGRLGIGFGGQGGNAVKCQIEKVEATFIEA